MKKYILLLFFSISVLMGCGQTGPLYLPEADTDKDEQQNAKKESRK